MVLRTKLNPGVSRHRDFSLQADKVALLVIDVQDYVWLANTAHDHFCNTYHQGLEKISALSKEFRRVRDDENSMQGGEVIFSYYQSLTTNKRDVSVGVKLSGDRYGSFPGPNASNLFLDQCQPVKAYGKGDIQIPKTSTSVFHSTNLNYVLRNLGIEQLVITGFLAEQGIQAAARDAADLGYFVTVVQDACTAQTMEQHESGLRNMKQHARIMDTDAIIQELRLDFAEKKAGAAGTSVLETTAAEKQEAAVAIVQYLRSEGLDKAAEMAETRFIGATAKRYTGKAETVGVPVDFGATIDCDVKVEPVHQKEDNCTLKDAPSPEQLKMDDHGNEEVFDGEPDGTSSFLSIKDESLYQCEALADEYNAEEEDRKPPAVEIVKTGEETRSREMLDSSGGLDPSPEQLPGRADHIVLPEQADVGEVESQMAPTSREVFVEETKDEDFASKVDDGSFHTGIDHFEPAVDESAKKVGTMPFVDGGSMETDSSASARAQFQSRNDMPVHLPEEPMPVKTEKEQSSIVSGASALSKDPDGSFGREDPSTRHLRNPSSFSNFGSSSSIPNVVNEPETSSPPTNQISSERTNTRGSTAMSNGMQQDAIPEEQESNGTGMVSRMMGPFRRRQADPPANRFSSQSIIGDPTKRR